MKNLKVRTKLNLILTLVILLVVLASAVSINNMNQVKDKALDTIDASSRQSYDDSIKQQVSVVISLLSEVYDEYKAGAYTLDEAKKLLQTKFARCVTEMRDIFGLINPTEQMSCCSEVIPKEPTVWEHRMRKVIKW